MTKRIKDKAESRQNLAQEAQAHEVALRNAKRQAKRGSRFFDFRLS